jgi:hypothetical protein
MADKATMTLNLTPQEMQVLTDLAKAKDLTKTAVIRQALRLYQMVDVRLSGGETMSFSGDKRHYASITGGLT